MATITPHTTRSSGTVLTANIYNTDHQVHITNANNLNTEVGNLADVEASTGLIASDGGGSIFGRSIQGTSDQIIVTDGDGVSGDPTLSVTEGLADISGLDRDDGNFIVGDGSNWVAESGDTALASLGGGSTGIALFKDTSAADARTELGLGTIATQDADSVDVDGGAMDGVTIGANSSAEGTFSSLGVGVAPAGPTLTMRTSGLSGDFIDCQQPDGTTTAELAALGDGSAALLLNEGDGTTSILLRAEAGGGTATTPAIKIGSDADALGLYRVDEDDLGITANGNLHMRFNGNGNAVMGRSDINANTTPGIAFNGGGAIDMTRDGPAEGNLFLRSSLATSHVAEFFSEYTTFAGDIEVDGASASFNSASDERLKDMQGELSVEDAIAVIRADPVMRFRWKGSGKEAVGWSAQSSYAASPDLAKPGKGKPGDKDFKPWTRRVGAREPYLWAAMANVLDRLDAAGL